MTASSPERLRPQLYVKHPDGSFSDYPWEKAAVFVEPTDAPAPSGVKEATHCMECKQAIPERLIKRRNDIVSCENQDCSRYGSWYEVGTALAAPSPDTLAADYANACKEIEGLERNVRELRASLGAPAGLRELLVEILTTAIRLPNERYAYSRCNVCEMPWWDEKEQHQRDCWVPRLRAALASAPGAPRIRCEECGHTLATTCRWSGCSRFAQPVPDSTERVLGEPRPAPEGGGT